MNKPGRMIVSTLFLLLPLSVSTAGLAGEPSFPAAGTYWIYILGEKAGKSAFTARTADGKLEIRSETSILFGDFDLELESTTLADGGSFLPISFLYEGVTTGDTISGEVFFFPDSIVGTIRRKGGQFPSKKRTGHYQTLVFENYVAVHEILLARAFLRTGEDFRTFSLFYPSDFLASEVMVSYESELELDTPEGSILATKLGVTPQGGIPFFSYIDAERALPVYLDFPGSRTEIFLEQYYGENPKPKYRKYEQ